MRMIQAAFVAAIAFASAANAAPTTFFGEDTNNGNNVTSHPNADAARTSFFSNLVGVGTQTFESYATGTNAPILVDFGSAGTATLSAPGTVENTTYGSPAGRFAISGTQYYDTNGTFNLTFSRGISAFGFYGIDIGDVSASLSLTLTGSNGTTTLAVPNIVGTVANGSVLYFGFYDTANTYTSISFAGAGSDVFGFDDFSIGSRAQVAPTVPEPASWAMMIAGIGAIGAALRRRPRATARLA